MVSISAPTLIYVLSLSSLASAVSVAITSTFLNIQQYCHDLRPGQCCKALYISNVNYPETGSPNTVLFTFLHATDIAAAWGRQGINVACSGIPVATGIGPNEWMYVGDGALRPLEASYVTLPKALPPGETEANWLTAEGMLGLAWGTTEWFAEGAAGLGSRLNRLRRRGIVSEKKGTAYIRGPSRSRWPDVVVVNGTTYEGSGTVGDVYRSSDGRALDLGG